MINSLVDILKSHFIKKKYKSNDYINILKCLILKELKVRYEYSLLGYFWAFLNPLVFACVYYFAFKVILRIQMENYSLFLLTGMFPWLFIANAIGRGTKCYSENITLIKGVKIPLSTIPLSVIIHEGIHFLFSVPILIIFILFMENNFHITWLYQIPIIFIVQVVFLYSIIQFLSISNLYVKDIDYLVTILISITFFLTPIIYSIEMIPEKYHLIFMLSPFTSIIESWRSVLINGLLPVNTLTYLCTITVFLLFITRTFYKKNVLKLGDLV